MGEAGARAAASRLAAASGSSPKTRRVRAAAFSAAPAPQRAENAARAGGRPGRLPRAGRAVDARMAAAGCRAGGPRPRAGGPGIGGGRGIAREAGIGIGRPRRGRGTTAARRADCPRDGRAGAGMAEWRRRGLRGAAARPAPRRARPRGARAHPNSHSPAPVPAGAPRDAGPRGSPRAGTLAHAGRASHARGARRRAPGARPPARGPRPRFRARRAAARRPPRSSGNPYTAGPRRPAALKAREWVDMARLLPAARGAPGGKGTGRLLPVVIYLVVEEPSRSDGTLATVEKIAEGLRDPTCRYYERLIVRYLVSENGKNLEMIKLGFFYGNPVRRRRGARRRIISSILAAVLDVYRASGVAFRLSRVIDTRMTAAEYRALEDSYPGAEGSGEDVECGISAREAGIGIECPLCGAGTTMARRGDYPWDAHAKSGLAEWRRRGLGGEPRPTLQWVRPHGECAYSNSHSLVLVPAGAPRDGGSLGGFVLVRKFAHHDSVPHVYGAG